MKIEANIISQIKALYKKRNQNSIRRNRGQFAERQWSVVLLTKRGNAFTGHLTERPTLNKSLNNFLNLDHQLNQWLF